MALKARLVKVTPKMAEEWLKLNHENRRLSPALVTRYAEDMKAGRWEVNGEPLIFTVSGHLSDGQHRLGAVVEAGVPVMLLVVEGVADSTFTSVDQGRVRPHAEILRMLGHKNASFLAAAAGLLYTYESGGVFNPSRSRVGRRVIDEVIQKNPGLGDSVQFACDNQTPIVSKPIMAFAHYVFSRVEAEQAARFCNLLATGDGVGASTPIGLLRQRLIEESAAGRKLDRRLVAYLIFRTWNAVRNKERLAKLQLPRSFFTNDPRGMSVELPKVA
jgi:hypothetical protein